MNWWEVSMKSWPFVLIFFMNAILGSAAYQYHSLCVGPKFSPNEKFIAFWDTTTIENYGRKNTLQIFSIDANRATVVAERIFQLGDITGTDDQEDPGKFECLAWSPDGRHIAFALNARDVEIYDTQAKKVVAALDLCTQACAGVPLGWINEKGDIYFKEKALCYGYSRIEWLDQNRILAEYTSEVSPCEWTAVTYGVIEKKDNSFRIKQAVLPADAAIYKTSRNEKNYVLIVETTSTGKVSKVWEKKYDFDRTLYSLIAAQENSFEKNVIAFSRTGSYAVVCSNSDPIRDRNPFNNKITSEMIRIPPAFRSYFLKMQEGNR